MTLAITIACLSLVENTFDLMELDELSANDGGSVPGRYHAMICDAVTGKVYVVREAKLNGSRPAEGTRVPPSKVVYFEYVGRKAPYSHVVCQAEHQSLSRGERWRICEAYRALPDLEEDCEAAGQRPVATRQYRRASKATVAVAAAVPTLQTEGPNAIGASHGGVAALERIISSLPSDLNAAVFVVLHIGSSSRSNLPDILGRACPLPVAWARHTERIIPARIYVAPPDQHMLLAHGYIRTVHGPKENHTRPAVDPLFRSAALAYGAEVIGVVLTGGLDNGTAGLLAVKDRGGITVVQDPNEALAPSMPVSALKYVEIDHCLTLDEIGPFLMKATAQEPGDPDPKADAANSASHLLAIENEFANNGLVPQHRMEEIAIASPLTCPECQSVLYQIRDDRAPRFRCRFGHAFSAKTLLQDLAAAREDSLWSAMRAVLEEADLARCLAQDSCSEDMQLARFLTELADRAQDQVDKLRKVIASVSDLIEPDRIAPRL